MSAQRRSTEQSTGLVTVRLAMLKLSPIAASIDMHHWIANELHSPSWSAIVLRTILNYCNFSKETKVMQIWRHVDPQLLAEFLIQAARTYAQGKDRQSEKSGEESEIAHSSSG